MVPHHSVRRHPRNRQHWDTEASGEYANLSFDDENKARDFLEHQAGAGTKEEYEHPSLHRLQSKKIREAVEVLTDQAGIGDIVPDGGKPEDIHQIPNQNQGEFWFWNDPTADMILKEEGVEPYRVVGLIESEVDVDRFIHWYSDRYGLKDASHHAKYRAGFDYMGVRPSFEYDDTGGSDPDSVKQVHVTEFLSQE